MIVVAIIGILASIAIPAYQDYIARSQMSEAIVLMDGLKTNVTDNFAQTGVCPNNGNAADAIEAGLAVNTDIKGKYVASVTADGVEPNCRIIATMKATGVSAELAGKTIALYMNSSIEAGALSKHPAVSGSIEWACDANVKQKYLPKACVGAA